MQKSKATEHGSIKDPEPSPHGPCELCGGRDAQHLCCRCPSKVCVDQRCWHEVSKTCWKCTGRMPECDPNGNGGLSFAELDDLEALRADEEEEQLRMLDGLEDLPDLGGQRMYDYDSYYEALRAVEKDEQDRMLGGQVDKLNAAVAAGSAATIAAAALQCSEEQQELEQKWRRRHGEPPQAVAEGSLLEGNHSIGPFRFEKKPDGSLQATCEYHQGEYHTMSPPG